MLLYFKEATDSEPKGVIPLLSSPPTATGGDSNSTNVFPLAALKGGPVSLTARPSTSALLAAAATAGLDGLPMQALERIFVIKRLGRTYYLQASSVEEMNRWLRCLRGGVTG